MGRLKMISMRKDSTMPNSDIKRPKSATNVISQTIANFSKQTSISGISNAGVSRSHFRRVCWLLVFAIFGAFTFYAFQAVINDYLNWPVTTSIYIEHKNQVIDDVSYYLYISIWDFNIQLYSMKKDQKCI